MAIETTTPVSRKLRGEILPELQSHVRRECWSEDLEKPPVLDEKDVSNTVVLPQNDQRCANVRGRVGAGPLDSGEFCLGHGCFRFLDFHARVRSEPRIPRKSPRV